MRLWLFALTACGRINFGPLGDGDGGDGSNDTVAIRSGCAIPGMGLFVGAVAADSQGNAYLLGRFDGTLQLGADTFVDTTSNDNFVVSIAPDCTVRWAHQFKHETTVGGIVQVGRIALAADATGSVYVVSDWTETLDPGDGLVRTSAGGGDVLLAKLDPAGNLAWMRQIGGTSNDTGSGVVIAANGDAIIAGSFGATITLDGTAKTSAGGGDFFVARYASDGTFVWGDKFGGAGDDYASRIALDAAENIHVAGGFTGSTNVGTMPLTSAGDFDIWFGRYGAGPIAQMSGSFGGPLAEYGLGVAADLQGRTVIAGQFGGTLDVGLGPMTTAGGSDVYVVGLASDGSPRWARQFGAAQSDYCDAVSSDGAGNILVTGVFYDTVDFGDGPRTATNRSTFAVSLSPDGATRWVHTIEASTAASGSMIVENPTGGAILAGTFGGTMTLGDSVLESGASGAAFIAHIR